MTGNLTNALKYYLLKILEGLIGKDCPLVFFTFSFKDSNRFKKVEDALIDAKGSEWVSNEDGTAMFIFFKPKDRSDIDPVDVVPAIQTIFRKSKHFDVPKDSDIAKFSVNGNDYWAIKIEFD